MWPLSSTLESLLMVYRRLSLFILGLSAFALLGLSACGQKGPLYLEDKAQNTQTQQTDSSKDKQNQK